jgi:hypothetical protein
MSESGILGETALAKTYRFFTVSLPKTAFKDGKATRHRPEWRQQLHSRKMSKSSSNQSSIGSMD